MLPYVYLRLLIILSLKVPLILLVWDLLMVQQQHWRNKVVLLMVSNLLNSQTPLITLLLKQVPQFTSSTKTLLMAFMETQIHITYPIQHIHPILATRNLSYKSQFHNLTNSIKRCWGVIIICSLEIISITMRITIYRILKSWRRVKPILPLKELQPSSGVWTLPANL